MSANQVIRTAGKPYVLATGAVAVDNEYACLTAANTVTAASVTTGLRLIGLFDIPNGASITGDGTKTVRVRFLAPNEYLSSDNDGTDAVTAAGQVVYLTNGHTVSTNDTGTSIAGVSIGFDGSKVEFLPLGFAVGT